jgi:hypothetical protein
MSNRWPWSWWAALALAVLIGIGALSVPIAPSPGRWQVDAVQAVHDESASVLHYVVMQPRAGDRIADSLYLALLEGEDAWTAAYLQRRYAALAHAAARLPIEHKEAHNTAALTLQTIEHYQALIAAAQADHDAFQRLIADQVGPQLREHAVDALDRADR